MRWKRITTTTRTIRESRKFLVLTSHSSLNAFVCRHFADLNNEATDEVWYKRAVEYHYNNPSSFVFSVPFDIGDTRPTLVTATHAIFKEENGQKAPAAVVGVHIDYDKFEKNFMKVTTGAEGHGYKVGTTFHWLSNRLTFPSVADQQWRIPLLQE